MNYTKSLIDFIGKSTSAFHSVNTAVEFLEENGFKNLNLSKNWKLKFEEKYFVKIYDSTLIAFVPHKDIQKGMRIAIAHTDFPCLKIKPNPVICQNGYGKLNVEVYGGMILNTWLDRPLSIAGKVVLKGNNIFKPNIKLVDLKRAVATIPNLAIHMDRQINTGKALNKQKELLPVVFLVKNSNKSDTEYLLELLSKELNCEKDEILAYELNLYQVEKGCYLGFNDEFISSPRIDNITSVKACVEGIISDSRQNGLDVIALFDNEEVGSKTKQGGASNIFTNVIERIYGAFKLTRQDFLVDLHKSFMLSVDVAHAMHPNYPEKNDITNKPILNAGIAIKTASSQSYAGDSEAVAIIKSLCKQYNISYQQYVNRSDIQGGSTLGSIVSAFLPMQTLDIGIPILAMHSARELMGKSDQQDLENLIKVFFK